MAARKTTAGGEERMVVVLDGVEVGRPPELAAAVVRAVAEEAERRVDRTPPGERCEVVYVAVGKAFVGLRLEDRHPSAKVRERHFVEAKVVFRTAVQEALHRHRVRAETASGTLAQRTGEPPRER